jgi:hypothetical protein
VEAGASPVIVMSGKKKKEVDKVLGLDSAATIT